MEGNLSIQGVVRDSFGNVASGVYVTIAVYEGGVYWEPERGGSDYRQLGYWGLYSDETGSYSFNNLVKVEAGHYEVWFNGDHKYGKAYENSGYYIMENGDIHLLMADDNSHLYLGHDRDEMRGDIYTLNVTVHPVTDSAFSGVIWYQDADGVTENFFSRPLGPDHRIELNRGESPDKHEYTIGDGYFTSDGSRGYLSGLAGGTYYLIFQYIRSDGVKVSCTSPSFEIASGETKQFEYTIRECPPD
jgi:hypothetical protein